jgi:hypothetical protein
MTIAIGSFVFKYATPSALDSITSLASLPISSCGIASSPFVEFTSDSTSNSARNIFLVVVSPFDLLCPSCGFVASPDVDSASSYASDS